MSSRRSHPPSLLRHVERLARDDRLFGPGDLVLCACSGGPDSTALLHALAILRPRLGHRVVAHGVDHGLRPEAAGELDLARAVAEAAGVSFGVTRVDLADGANLQARARIARHQALADAARAAGAKVVALGHTADDKAETLLLRLLRGAGPRGLAVMPSRAPAVVPDGVDLVRPLLQARRGDVLAHLARHELAFATDPSNADRRFLRARVRHELVPLLESLSPTVVGNLAALADMLGEDRPPGSEEPLRQLGRDQRLAVARAKRLGRAGVSLRVEGGRDVDVTFPGGTRDLNEKVREDA